MTWMEKRWKVSFDDSHDVSHDFWDLGMAFMWAWRYAFEHDSQLLHNIENCVRTIGSLRDDAILCYRICYLLILLSFFVLLLESLNRFFWAYYSKFAMFSTEIGYFTGCK